MKFVSHGKRQTSLTKWVGMIAVVSGSILASGCSVKDAGEARSTQAVAELTPEYFAELEQRLINPTPAHAVLAEMAGDWNTTIRYWMTPDQRPYESKGTSRTVLEMGQKFLRERFMGEWMGKPFTGMGYTGFDPVTSQYQSLWIDSSAPFIHVMEGSFDEASQTFTFRGNQSCPIRGERVPVKMFLKLGTNGERVLESYTAGPDGIEYKAMEIEYTRK